METLNQCVVVLFPLLESQEKMNPFLDTLRGVVSDLTSIHLRVTGIISESSENDKVRQRCEQVLGLCGAIAVAVKQEPEQQAPNQVVRGDLPNHDHVGSKEEENSDDDRT